MKNTYTKQEVIKLVEAIIGEDDEWSNDNSLTRNQLRAEQRTRGDYMITILNNLIGSNE